MGDLADDLYSEVYVQMADDQCKIEDWLKHPDSFIKEAVLELLESNYYSANDYTKMIKGIIRYDKFTHKQRIALIKHLIDYDFD